MSNIAIELAESIHAVIDESYQAPDAYICPVCQESTIESNKVNIDLYDSKEIMKHIKHKESCLYIKIIKGK